MVTQQLPNQEKIKAALQTIKEKNTIQELRGVEGMARKIYYEGWEEWLQLKSPFKRVYNPPNNPINSLLSFLNSLMYATVVSEIYRTSLHPGIAFLHEPQSRRYSLALDLSEIMKPVIVDRLLGSLWNKGEIKDSDFLPHSNGIILKEEARKTITQAWDKAITRTTYSKELKRNTSYRWYIRKDCYSLIRYLLEGTPLNFFKI
jgi:CRISPR-associated protein Cas1